MNEGRAHPGAPARQRRVVAAFDKFRASASAGDLNEVVARLARARDVACDVVRVSDGGEGFAGAFGATTVTVMTRGPLGEERWAPITLDSSHGDLVGVFGASDVVGRDLLEHPRPHEALAATSECVGTLILAAARLGARRVIVGCGGTATSDAGRGCYDVLRGAGGLPVPVTVATDVTADFFGARRYAVQKGVREDDLALIDQRLEDARALYLEESHVDVGPLARSGAGGGIAGALAALGAQLASGFDLVARAQGLDEHLAGAALVVTGEGRLDAGSLEGKVVLEVAKRTPPSCGLLVVCGSLDDEVAAALGERFANARFVSLSARWPERALSATLSCVDDVVTEALDDAGL